MTKAVAVSALVASALGVVNAFEISFPNNDGGYWVANYTNTVNWKANSTDPTYFSVQLLNKNSSMLNGNFQIGNALVTQNGSAQIFIDQIPAGTYSILFVNSSNYQLDHPQVYQSSNTFQVKPNGTTPAPITANIDADASHTSTKPPSDASTVTLSHASSTSTSSNGAVKKVNSAGMTHASIGAALGAGFFTLLFGLGVGLMV